MNRASAVIFTILTLGIVCGVVSWTMAFLVYRLQLPGSFWLIPIFGGVGGVVGSLMDNENQLYLVTFEFSSGSSRPSPASNGNTKSFPSFHMGIVADVIMGLAGAVSAAFVFGKTLELHFKPTPDAQEAITIIGLSLVAGVFGRKIIRKAGEKLTEDDVKNISAEQARAVTGKARAQSLTQDAEDNIEKGVGIDRALEMSQAAIEADSTYIKAYITQGRALKRLNKLSEAIEVMNKALSVEPGYPYALYNRACYGALLARPADSVLADLEQAINALPKFAVVADSDNDFASLRGNPRFAELVLQGATRATEADHDYFEGHIARANALKRLGRLDDAFAATNQALRIKANDPGALYKRASCSVLLKHSKDEAARDLAAAIRLKPELAKSAREDPDFASLADVPELVELLRSVGGSGISGKS